MNILTKISYLLPCWIFLLTNCTNEAQSQQGPAPSKSLNTYVPNFTVLDTTSTLKFTEGIRAILEDRQGNIWIGSHAEGVAKYDGQHFTYYTTKNGLSDNQVRSIFEYPDGTIWFECGMGISSFNGERIITHFVKNYLTKHDWRVGKNDLWFKGDEGIGYNAQEGQPGVFRYDGQKLNYHVFPLEEIGGGESYYSVSAKTVRGQQGRVWFGTYGAVIGYDGKDFTIIDSDLLGLTEETGYLHVRSIFEDSQGRLWIGNNGLGVWLYNDNTFTHFSKEQGLLADHDEPRSGQRSPPNTLEHVFAIGEDRDGNIWFGDRDTGAWRYDGQSMTNYTQADSLTTTHIWQIYLSQQGELWFAMGDGAVCRFNGESFEQLF